MEYNPMSGSSASAPLDSRFTTPEESPGFLLWQVSNAWQRRQRAALQPLNLTHAQYVLLANLAWMTRHGEPVSQAQLAAQAMADPMMTSQVVRTLEQKGFITRQIATHDSRARELAVTPEGHAMAAHATAVVEAVDAAFFGTVAADATLLLRQLLRHSET